MTREEEDKWIHRDKLARIENEELQAAGIILPKSRAHSRPRRERSPEKMNGHRRATDSSEQHGYSRSRKNSTLSVQTTESEIAVPAWDLRLPEEIAEDPEESQRQYWISNGSTKGSRIPVAKLSPAPIPPDYIERDAPVSRKNSGYLLEDDPSISMPKPARSRSNSGANALDETFRNQAAKRSTPEPSPTKRPTNGTRRPSAKDRQPAGRSKTRSTSNTRSTSATRPTTRSGEITLSKAPEGDPPWMVSAYKPDPRLPPDQQLLPTVARRLQQEKWEQEGKFGNIYDREFRPLNEDPFPKSPDFEKPKDSEEQQDQWPLRGDAQSPSSLSRPGTSSYSTMPRIQDKSPLPSPRPPQQSQMQAIQPIRVPDADVDAGADADAGAPDRMEEKTKSGCGCCVVM